MKKIIYLLLILPFTTLAQQSIQSNHPLLPYLNEAQNSPNRNVEVNIKRVTTFSKENANTFWKSLPEMQHPLVTLVLKRERRSLVGKHYFYEQHFNSIPVYNSYLQINTNFNGEIISMTNHLISVSNWDENTTAPDKNFQLLSVNGQPTLIKTETNRNIKTISDENGRIIQTNDISYFFSNDDTTVTGKVFRPDPLTPSNLIYGQEPTLLHYNDSDYAAINAKRIDVTFPATLLNDTFWLENKYAKVDDFRPPYHGRAQSKTPDFNFTRGQIGFKEVMALYHISNYKQYLESIGLDSIITYQVKVDAHGASTDVSQFTPNDSILSLGLGGIPDAEDADVIVHECTHSISHTITDLSQILSTARRAIEEGNCDVMAALYSREYAPFNWRYLFNWDAPNPVAQGQFPIWSGRNANSSKKYRDTINDYYSDCEIWSSTILDVMEELQNREVVTKLLFTSMYFYTPNTTMAEAATLFMQADSLLYNKFNSWRMGQYFVYRELGDFSTGLSDVANKNSFSILNSIGFAKGESDLKIISATSKNMSINIFDVHGKLIYQAQNENSISLPPALFNSGLYVIEVRIDNQKQTSKVIRF